MAGILDPKRVDRDSIDAFTPLVIFAGMLSRAGGADRSQALVINVILELTVNAFRPTEPFVGRLAGKSETSANIVADVVAAQVGWTLMDEILKAQAKA